MHNVIDFIKWALTHVDPSTVPENAKLPLALEECGTEPWHYLFGTVRSRTTRALIEERWRNYYSTHGWPEERYKTATASFRESEYATDCQGLLDAWLTHICNEKTDINADMNYQFWCTEKGKISDIERSYLIGEAVFCCNPNGRMSHVGWVCGFDCDGEPLVVEARGLWYGVVITRFESRPWTHRGLMTKKFEYTEDNEMDKPIKLEKTSPMMQGDAILKMQQALNALGYADVNGNALEEDGKCGIKTIQAVTAFANAHADCMASSAEPIAVFTSNGGTYQLNLIAAERGA